MMNTMSQFFTGAAANNFVFSPEFWMSNYYWLPIIIFWSLVWKGLALWKAGRRYQLGWFVALLIVNTMGLLEIFYLVAYHDMKEKGKK